MSQTVEFSKQSINVFFHILTRCNLSCRHCYINPSQHGDNILPLETIIKWLGAFSYTDQNVNLIFLGGDPPLHPELDRAVIAAKQMEYASVTIDTNGYLFHDILNKITPGDVDFISFSLDGATRKTNDLIRGTGCYDNCMSGIKQAVSRKFNTSLIFTVSNQNIHELNLMPTLIKDLGINRFFIQVIGIRGKSANLQKDLLQVDRNAWLSLIPAVAEHAADLGISTTYPKVFMNNSDAFECAGQLADNYFIFPNGRVYRCPLCEDYPLHSLEFIDNRLKKRDKITEQDLFELDIPEGCVMNKLIQPDNLRYDKNGTPEYKIACCLLKEEVPAAK